MAAPHADARTFRAKAAPAPKQAPGVVLAPSYVLVDVDSGRVLAARKEHEHRFPASTTKTMMALCAIENGDLNKTVTIGPNPPKTGEQSINLQQGETFVLRDLLKAALIKSANDSCVAIAEGVAGTVPKFVAMMNAKAKEIGANDSHFMNPHGLHDPNHYTSVYDLSLIARRAMTHPIFNQIIATKEDTIHGNAKIGPTRFLKNKNKLLFRWALCDGVKTGFTHPAGRCLVASATRVDPSTHRRWRLLAVVMHAPDSWTDCQNLLQMGFKNFVPREVAQANQTLAKLDVKGGANQVEAIAPKDLEVPVRAGEQGTVSTHVRALPVAAPIQKDETVAKLDCSLNGKLIASLPLLAKSDIEESLPARIVPAAAEVVPSSPIARYALYACALFGTLLLIFGLKLRAAERHRHERENQRNGARRLIG